MRALRRTELREAGFSLVELLIAIGLLAAIGMTITGVMSNVFLSQGDLEARSEFSHSIEIGFAKIFDDLNMAFLTDASFQGRETTQATGFVGDAQGLNFSTFSHVHYVKNYRDSDQVDVGYRLESAQNGLSNLVRSETDYLRPKVDEAGPGFVVIPRVKTLEVSYWDANQKDWKEEWDTNSIEYAGMLPARVSIKLTVVAEPQDEDDETPFEQSFEVIVPIEMYNQKISF